MRRFLKAGLVALVVSISIGVVHGRTFTDFYAENGGGNGYGDWESSITVDGGREWAYAYGWAGVYDGLARVDVWISGGSVRWMEEHPSWAQAWTAWDWRPGGWCSWVQATGDFWQIDDWGSWEWHLLSGWAESAASVDTGYCID